MSELSKIINQARIIKSELARLNITLSDDGTAFYSHRKDCYAFESLCEDNKDAFFNVPSVSFKDEMILALATTQEEQQADISQDQINYVNNFFDFQGKEKISFDDVQYFYGRYI